MLGGDLVLDLLVADDPAFLRINQKHPARLQPAFEDHVFRRNTQHTRLRGKHQGIVFGNVVARGPEAVAVEHAADDGAVGKGHRGRPVPRLHQTAMVLVKGSLLSAHGLVVFPRLGNHHHHHVCQRAPTQRQQFERIVELGRIRAVFVDDGEELADVIAEVLGGQHPLARVHPIAVAAHGVYLAIVDDIAIGMRPLPAREGVGAKARMH